MSEEIRALMKQRDALVAATEDAGAWSRHIDAGDRIDRKALCRFLDRLAALYEAAALHAGHSRPDENAQADLLRTALQEIADEELMWNGGIRRHSTKDLEGLIASMKAIARAAIARATGAA